MHLSGFTFHVSVKHAMLHHSFRVAVSRYYKRGERDSDDAIVEQWLGRLNRVYDGDGDGDGVSDNEKPQTLVRVVDGALGLVGMVGTLVGVDYQTDRHNPVVVEFGDDERLRHRMRFARWQVEQVTSDVP